MKNVTILMATYNGELYIKEQVESLLNQSYSNIKIIISDDCSKDNTTLILEEYREKYPDIISIRKTKKNTGSPKENFFGMMIESKEDYIMLCDQDDVWLPNKIELTMKKMNEMEKKYGKNTPLLVHTDLKVVDQNEKVIHESFIEAMNANYEKTLLKNQVIQNTLTGCTALYNKALAELINEEPSYCVMHDWWLNLIASAFGHIEYIKDQTILYRQHGKNEIGAKDIRTLSYKIKILINNKSAKIAIDQTYDQGKCFLNMYKNQLSKEQIKLLETYTNIPSQNKIKRCLTVIKLGTLKNGISRQIGQFLFI